MDLAAILYYIIQIFSIFLWPLCFCYFANLTIDRIFAINHSVYAMNWYDFPSKFHKYFLLAIVQAQKPIQFTGLNLIYCTMETFGKVRNAMKLNMNVRLIRLKFFKSISLFIIKFCHYSLPSLRSRIMSFSENYRTFKYPK